MDAKVERPELRPFKQKPVEMVRVNRGKYLAAVFTIARAYMAAGCPRERGMDNVADFEQWSRWVRFPLMWLGMKDPLLSMEEARALDPVRSALAERIAALKQCIGIDKAFTAHDVHKGAEMGGDLFDAFSRDGKTVSAKAIGNQLMKDLGRVSGGYSVVLAHKNPKQAHSYKVLGPESGGPKG
jgi:putative DNA primase/helicase